MGLAKRDQKGEAIWRKLILPEEDRNPARLWLGSFRWFRSPNVIRLEDYRSQSEMNRVREVLLRPRRNY
jgi:hypothetical protein